MAFFSWIIKADQEKYISSVKGVSSAYVMPLDGRISPLSIAGSTIFIILRGKKEDVIFKKIYSKKIEEIIDEDTGKGTGNYLLSTDLLHSFSIVPDYASGLYFSKCTLSKKYPYGVSELQNEEAEALLKNIYENIQNRFVIPKKKDLHIENMPEKLSPYSFSVQLLSTIIKNFSLSMMWGSPKEKNPFANFSTAYLKETLRSDKDNISNILHELSESLFSFDREPSISKKNSTIHFPTVDTVFEPIDINKIYARKFTAVENKRDISSLMMKTQDAEKRHQDILKDLCQYFISKGLQPEQSSSIDLAIRKKDIYDIFEIKTTTQDNIINQAAKGSFQLAIYSMEMISCGFTVGRKILLIEASEDFSVNNFISETVKSMGFDVIFYYNDKNWPNKISPQYITD